MKNARSIILRNFSLYLILILFLIIAMIYAFRITLLKSIATFLIDQDKPIKVEAAFVLSGNSIDRAEYAAKLYKQGYLKTIVCSGGNLHPLFQQMGFTFTEADITKKVLMAYGVHPSNIKELPYGTSTKEEAKLIFSFTKRNNWDTIMVISSEFHTRRIKYALREKYKMNDFHVLVCGTSDKRSAAHNWWKNEDGLIMVNNEWIKLLYYYYKY